MNMLQEKMVDIALGRDSQYSRVEIIGINPDVDTGTEDVWDFGGDHTFMAAAAALYISSSNNADDMVIRVTGLDANWDVQTTTVTLVGQTKTAISGTWIRINEVKNTSASNPAGDVYVYEDLVPVAGVPGDAAKVRAKIIAASGIAKQGFYSIPDGYIGILTDWFGNTQKAFDGTMTLDVREFGGAFIKYRDMYLFQEHLPQPLPILGKEIPAKSDVKLKFTATANNTVAEGGFAILLRKNG
ncbi:MAG: hypothetical protein C4586_08360 [Anaerolineaceae bacterium]|nr:MAG: hypothetical protein C4586_08360 [Anaerolineaceae bacterium]